MAHAVSYKVYPQPTANGNLPVTDTFPHLFYLYLNSDYESGTGSISDHALNRDALGGFCVSDQGSVPGGQVIYETECGVMDRMDFSGGQAFGASYTI